MRLPSGRAAGRIRRSGALLAMGALVAAFLTVLASLHLTLNLTPSMPLGLYRELPANRVPRRGDLVLICAPEGLALYGARAGYLPPGDCTQRTAPLLKLVAAVGGDIVELRPDAVVIDGASLPGSATQAVDVRGRPIPRIRRGRYALRRDEVWLWSPSPIGWDSRYYGPLPVRGLAAFAQPFAVLPRAQHDIATTMRI